MTAHYYRHGDQFVIHDRDSYITLTWYLTWRDSIYIHAWEHVTSLIYSLLCRIRLQQQQQQKPRQQPFGP